MRSIRIFVDFGSTFTKVAAFDMDKEELIARVQSPSTVDTDIMIGLRAALDALSEVVVFSDEDVKNAVACSSAAGGLRMVCIGLVPEYTTEAGRLAALGAGAKVIGTFSYELSKAEAREIDALNPDIVLLTGGTDGGNKKTICHNAQRLEEYTNVRNIIVAGNKSARDDLEDIFENTDKNIIYAKNVMPEFGMLDIDPVNEKIRELFINRITDAKGIAGVEATIGKVLMPTPSAVLEAAKLIANGITGQYNGLGELLLVDVGGATTDVYTVASGVPTRGDVNVVGLREPYAKRTVEGDLGLFHNLDTLSEIADKVDMETVESLRASLSIPDGEEQRALQMTLTRLAVKTAVTRHVGRADVVMTGNGPVTVQRGKDMTKCRLVIGAGGPVAFSADPKWVLGGAVKQEDEVSVLKPENPKFMTDDKYILFAIGLMSQTEPEKALRIIKKYLKEI